MLHRTLKFLLCIFFLPSLWATEDRHYVLYRGVHFPTHLKLSQPEREEICQRQSQDCVATYRETRKLWDTSDPQIAAEMARQLQPLNNYTAFTGSQTPWDSWYAYIVQKHVSEYDAFKREMKQVNSELRGTILAKVGLTHPNDIIFISTSFRAEMALKFASGTCRPKGVQQGEQYDAGPRGYMDIFMIPADEMGQLFPFFVADQHALRNLDVQDTGFTQTDYLCGAEVAFPFIIPEQYHFDRMAVYAVGRKENKGHRASKPGPHGVAIP